VQRCFPSGLDEHEGTVNWGHGQGHTAGGIFSTSTVVGGGGGSTAPPPLCSVPGDDEYEMDGDNAGYEAEATFGSPMLDEVMRRLRQETLGIHADDAGATGLGRAQRRQNRRKAAQEAGGEEAAQAAAAAAAAAAADGSDGEGGAAEKADGMALVCKELLDGAIRKRTWDEEACKWVTNVMQEVEWVQCENPLCLKWRTIPVFQAEELKRQGRDEKWTCVMNKWDPEHNSCDAQAEEWDSKVEKTTEVAGLAELTGAQIVELGGRGLLVDAFCDKDNLW
jgi:hypothetical protein